MLVRDVMKTNVVSIASSTALADARRIMDAHRIRRLPVMDKERLVGIVTKDAVDRAGPSELTTFSIHEISYLLNRLTVREMMVRDVVTVSPDATVEEAIALAQERGVGALIVLEESRVVGIATTNDFFYKILNPILGIGEPGTRISISPCAEADDLSKILTSVERAGARITSMFTMRLPDTDKCDCTMHLNAPNPEKVITELRQLGFTVEERAR